VRALALDWSLDGPLGGAFLIIVAGVATAYLLAARVGSERDRRHRRWPRDRTFCFLAGLAVLVVDLYSGIGTEADSRLSIHMVEHMVMWVVVAPLLVAGAPVRLALFALRRDGRRKLAGALRSRPVAALTAPVGSVALFSAVIVLTHLPAVYGLTLRNDNAHEAEHALYLLTAMVMWASILGVDPLPHRPGPIGQLACMAFCMLVMTGVAVWLGTTSAPVYQHYVGTLGDSALKDQRLAATIMWAGGLPAFAVPILARARDAVTRRLAPPRLRAPQGQPHQRRGEAPA
jgi:putative membrane protein